MNRAHASIDGVLVELDPPPWLVDAVDPWRIEAVGLWRDGGVALGLASARARVRVLIEPGAGVPRIRGLTDAIPPRAMTTLARALVDRLTPLAALPGWLEDLERLHACLTRPAPPGSSELGAVVQAWHAWPKRVADPSREIEAVVAFEPPTRSVASALAHHRFARGEFLAAFSAWGEAGSVPADAGFVELHLDALALAALGRRPEALDRLGECEARAIDAAQWLACAWLRETLDDTDGAIEAHEHVVALRGDPWDELRLARARNGEGARRLADPKTLARVPDVHSFVLETIKVLEEGGHHDAALQVLRAASADAPADLRDRLLRKAARLHTWRVEIEQARDCLAELRKEPVDTEILELQGSLDVLAGDPASGLRALEAARARGGGSLEALLWQAEAHLALGEPTRALACADEHIVAENTLCAYLVKARAVAESSTPDELERALSSPTFLDALVPDVLPSLAPREEVEAAMADPTRFSGLVARILEQLGGNRSPTPTWCRQAADGTPRLESVDARPSGRDAAVANLVRIRSEPPDLVLADFATVAADYPRSPHPHTYAGEVLIWLGRYEDALAQFDAADAKAPTRWSFVGRSAVYELTNRSAEAEQWSKDGIARFGELASATTHVYRGERLRRSGDVDGALRDLTIALEHKPRRVGARMNLALVHLARNDDEGWERETARILADAPAFLWEAGARPGAALRAAVLERALELMGGNRSSFLHTMIDTQRRFRIVPAPERVRAHARLTLGLARPALARAIRDNLLR